MSPAPSPPHVDLDVLGTVVRVHLDDPADRQAVEGPWHLCVLPAAERDVPEPRVVTLPATADEGARLAALTTLTQNVTRAAIGEQTGRLLMFHAGALSNLETGATVAYVAPGGTGKTTITTTLGSGRGYVTDETVAVTREGEIEPYPKPLSVRRAGGGKDEVAPSQVGLRLPGAPPWLAGLMIVRRDPDHVGQPEVRSLGLLDAIAALGPETSALAALPEPLLTCRDVIERAGGLLQVTYREAQHLEEIVTPALERRRA
jgi:hypothetical protein